MTPDQLQAHAQELTANLDADPGDIAARRDLLAVCLAQGQVTDAVNHLSTAMLLPQTAAESAAIADDMSQVLPLAMTANPDFARHYRLTWALAAAGATTSQARDRFLAQVADGNPLGLSADTMCHSANLFRDTPRTPFPLVDGRPYVHTVWFEITNQCNQKCTFCPDRNRQGARTRITLDRFKRCIDDLRSQFRVGSMQLNAYGEPLLHPDIGEMLRYLHQVKAPWPTFFTTHGLTLTQRALDLLRGNYPAGIAISLQNDSQESYAATRNLRIGDYDTLVERVLGLMKAVVNERADCHLRLYQLVSNGKHSPLVDPQVLKAFPSDADRFIRTVHLWEERAAEIARTAPPEAQARVHKYSDDAIAKIFHDADGGDRFIIPILHWRTRAGRQEAAFLSPRPVGNYAQLLPEQHPDWVVERRITGSPCSFTEKPSLALFASGRVGLCCLDLEGTATFCHVEDYPTLGDAIRSPNCLRLFAELANGVLSRPGCQICRGRVHARNAPLAAGTQPA